MPAPALSRRTLVLSAFGLGSLVALLLVSGAYYAYSHSHPPAPPPPGPPVYLRPEFTRRVMDKTEEEVIQAVGKPDDTSEDNDARYWHFKKRTVDPVTRETDTDVQVVIKNGKVTNVNF